MVTDQQFLKVWRKLGSPTQVAKELGVNVRNVYARRAALAAKGLKLPSKYKPGGEPVKKIEHSARATISVQTGSVIIFSDAHFWPGERTPANEALLKLCKDLRPTVVVANGDVFDGGTISRFPRIGWDDKPSVKDELKACTERLGEIVAAAPRAKFYWPLGNHDARYENFLAAKAPEFEGVEGFTLKSNFPDWEPCWSLWINDDVVIKHRFKGGIHATHNNTLTAGKTLVTGHLHSLKVSPYSDYNGTRYGVDTGTLASPSGPQFVDYTEDNPLNWRSGFAVLTFLRGMLLPPETVEVLNDGSVCFRGEIIHKPKKGKR
jgi:hypothetical protein